MSISNAVDISSMAPFVRDVAIPAKPWECNYPFVPTMIQSI